MSKFRWIDDAGETESLASCLRAVLANQGVEVAYDELVATLGLGALSVARPGTPPELWGTYARDGALVATAERYGLRLRDMHPPDAATGLHSSEEFSLHFVDSYVPLIGRALEHGQLALAWCGWPPPRERLWGVITAIRDDLIIGYTQQHGGEPLPLCGPALQVYVVEEFSPPARRSAGAMFEHVAAIARRAWVGGWSADPAVLSGAAAYEHWLSVIRDKGRHTPRGVAIAIGQLVAARASLARWLAGIALALDGSQRDASTAWASDCEKTVTALRPYATAEAVAQATPGLATALASVAKLDARHS